MTEIIITSSILILALLLVRKLCWGKISRRLQYGLWLLVAIRLLVPAQFFTSSLSVMNLIEHTQETFMTQWQTVHNEGETDALIEGDDILTENNLTEGIVNVNGSPDIQNAPVNSAGSPDGKVQEINRQDTLPQSETAPHADANIPSSSGLSETSWRYFETILWGIYAVGVILVAGCILLCNLQFRRKLAANRELIGQEGHLKIYLAARLESPCLCGIFAPAIYMTEDGLASQERKEHVLLHEMTHYRHFDHVWTLIRSLCLALYWFHPLVWVAAILSTEDSELACDEGTLAKLGEEHRQAYGRTLIEMMTDTTKTSRLMYCATGMINGKREIKTRITAIAAYKKQVIWIAALVVVFAVLLSACTAGNTEKETSNDNQTQESIIGEENDISGDDIEGENSESKDNEGEEPGSSEQVPPDTSLNQDENSQSELILGEGVILNADGSFRLAEYEAELTDDNVVDKIVFDVQYGPIFGADTGTITNELLREKLWEGGEVYVRILEGSQEIADEDSELNVLQEYSFADAHAGNGNMAVVRYENRKCIMLYSNLMYQGYGNFGYQIWQMMPYGSEPVLREEQSVSYVSPGMPAELGTNDENVIEQVMQVADEIDRYLSDSYSDILVNAFLDKEDCYLYGDESGLVNGVRRQTAFDVFMTEVGGSGLELSIMDYFYPDGMESLTQLPEEAEARILAGEILCMEISKENNTAGRLDLDGDGEKEVLYLDAIGQTAYNDGWSDWDTIRDIYRLRVDNQYYEGYADMMAPVVMAYSPDGEHILLALYDEGPSWDPMTTFFQYDETGIHPVGSIPGDLRSVTIGDDGVIHCSFRGDMIQTEYAYGYYYWDGSEIVMREDEIYYYLDDRQWREDMDMPLMLLEEITVYKERSESSESVVMKPQQVTNVASDMKEWILLEAEDGTSGWLRVVGNRLPSLDNRNAYDIFEGLNMVD